MGGSDSNKEVIVVEPLLSASDVSRILGMRRSWVYDAAWRGDLPCYKFGRAIRFKMDDVLAYRESCRKELAAS